MSVDIVKSMHIMTPQKTQKGNDYKHSNIGKYAGATAGVVGAGNVLYTTNKILKNAEFMDIIVDASKAVAQRIFDMSDDIKITVEELATELPKYAKRIIKCGTPVVMAFVIALGLGVGAISDAVANYFIKKNADKNSEVKPAQAK